MVRIASNLHGSIQLLLVQTLEGTGDALSNWVPGIHKIELDRIPVQPKALRE